MKAKKKCRKVTYNRTTTRQTIDVRSQNVKIRANRRTEYMANIRAVVNCCIHERSHSIIPDSDCCPTNRWINRSEIIVSDQEIHDHSCASFPNDVEDRFEATHIVDNHTDSIYVACSHRRKDVLRSMQSVRMAAVIQLFFDGAFWLVFLTTISLLVTVTLRRNVEPSPL